MYMRGIGKIARRRGVGQVLMTPSDCAAAGGSMDVNEDCVLPTGAPAPIATPAVPLASTSCAAGSSSACSWYDNIWATQGCLDWYAACDPTNAFYLTNTKGLIAGGSAVLGNTVSASLNNFLGLPQTSIPTWAWVAGFGLAAFLLLPPILKAVR